MMRPVFVLALLLAATASATAEQLLLDDRQLSRTALTRACYLGFIKLYDAEYFRSTRDAVGDGRCVRLSYLREFSAGDLDEATVETFRKRHGGDLVERYRDTLTQIGEAYRAVQPGDRYTYCVADSGGALWRDRRAVVRVAEADFAARFMQIWVLGEDGAQQPQWAFSEC